MSLTSIIATIVVLLLAAVLAIAGYYLRLTNRIRREAESLVPPPGKFVTIDGHRVHYVEEGSGPPILFVHGLGGTLFQFSHPLFRALSSDFRLIALDRPGSGYSTRRGRKAASPGEQADSIARFIEHMGMDKPLLVGHSLGGAISLAVAIRHPEVISGLALLAPLTKHQDGPPKEFAALAIASPAVRRIVAHTISAPTALKYSEQTLGFVFGPQAPPDDYAIAGGAMASLRPSHFYGTSTDLMAIGDELAEMETHYGEIGLPVGILFGSADRVLDHRANGLAMEGRIAGLDLEIAEGVGHMPQYAVPERVLAFIRRMADKAFAGRQDQGRRRVER